MPKDGVLPFFKQCLILPQLFHAFQQAVMVCQQVVNRVLGENAPPQVPGELSSGIVFKVPHPLPAAAAGFQLRQSLPGGGVAVQGLVQGGCRRLGLV